MAESFKLVSWNVTQGGARRGRTIVDELVAHDPLVIVLQELRPSSLPAIVEPLRRLGWTRFESTLTRPGVNSVGVVSRRKIRPLTTPLDCPDPRRWLGFEIEGVPAAFVNLHIPCAGKGSSKKVFWRSVLDYARAQVSSPLMIIGAFNTGLPYVDESGRTFVCSSAFRELTDIGYVDLWRKFHGAAREYTWFSNYGNGFRIDHAFASPGLAAGVARCWFAHEPRAAGVSDHSALCVEIKG